MATHNVKGKKINKHNIHIITIGDSAGDTKKHIKVPRSPQMGPWIIRIIVVKIAKIKVCKDQQSKCIY